MMVLLLSCFLVKKVVFTAILGHFFLQLQQPNLFIFVLNQNSFICYLHVHEKLRVPSLFVLSLLLTSTIEYFWSHIIGMYCLQYNSCVYFTCYRKFAVVFKKVVYICDVNNKISSDNILNNSVISMI